MSAIKPSISSDAHITENDLSDCNIENYKEQGESAHLSCNYPWNQ